MTHLTNIFHLCFTVWVNCFMFFPIVHCLKQKASCMFLVVAEWISLTCCCFLSSHTDLLSCEPELCLRLWLWERSEGGLDLESLTFSRHLITPHLISDLISSYLITSHHISSHISSDLIIFSFPHQSRATFLDCWLVLWGIDAFYFARHFTILLLLYILYYDMMGEPLALSPTWVVPSFPFGLWLESLSSVSWSGMLAVLLLELVQLYWIWIDTSLVTGPQRQAGDFWCLPPSGISGFSLSSHFSILFCSTALLLFLLLALSPSGIIFPNPPFFER